MEPPGSGKCTLTISALPVQHGLWASDETSWRTLASPMIHRAYRYGARRGYEASIHPPDLATQTRQVAMNRGVQITCIWYAHPCGRPARGGPGAEGRIRRERRDSVPVGHVRRVAPAAARCAGRPHAVLWCLTCGRGSPSTCPWCHACAGRDSGTGPISATAWVWSLHGTRVRSESRHMYCSFVFLFSSEALWATLCTYNQSSARHHGGRIRTEHGPTATMMGLLVRTRECDFPRPRSSR